MGKDRTRRGSLKQRIRFGGVHLSDASMGEKGSAGMMGDNPRGERVSCQAIRKEKESREVTTYVGFKKETVIRWAY